MYKFPKLVITMSCPEFDALYKGMTTDMGQKLSGYYMSLQSRYGDPRVYAQQQEAMARDQAAVQHAKSCKTAKLQPTKEAESILSAS